MSGNKSTDQQNQQHAHESEDERKKREAGVEHKSSHDHMSREKAGSHKGAGGGAKQGDHRDT
jgi:hypothetical protein